MFLGMSLNQLQPSTITFRALLQFITFFRFLEKKMICSLGNSDQVTRKVSIDNSKCYRKNRDNRMSDLYFF